MRKPSRTVPDSGKPGPCQAPAVRPGFPGRGRKLLPVAFLFLAASVAACGTLSTPASSSLEAIRERGRIVLITQNSANTYFEYREEPMGFEYDLAVQFARHLGVELEIVTPGWIEMFDMLDKGEGDFIAAGLTDIPSRRARVDFSQAYMMVRQMLIVHHDNREIRNVRDLSGKTIHVRAGTTYQERLSQLMEEGIDIDLVLVPDVPTEELIRQVAEGEIEATVADSNIALLNRRYHPDIRIAFPLSGEETLAWAVRKGNRDLLEAIDGFLREMGKNGGLKRINNRYYGDWYFLDRLDLKAFHSKVTSHLPRYQGTIRSAAETYGLDWRLVAAVIYQESHFNPRARSHTGVRGLMQLTQTTAGELGIENRLDPEQSIMGGVKYLASLQKRFDDVESERDRLLLALASYNVGYGHVRDAQQIARESGRSPVSWSSMREVLPLLRKPEYYRRTRHGYARGTEPVQFVDNVLTYYDILRRKDLAPAETLSVGTHVAWG